MTGAMIGHTRSWLRTQSVVVPDDWIEACVEWIKDENQGNQISQSRINELVFEQWLLADLHELGTQCLPEGLAETTKHQLSGSYALQVDSLVDVGQSFYSQLQKVQGTTNANAQVCAETSDQKPWDPKPSRMMMLTLTDGTNSIKGMEYKPLSCLNPTVQPGTKVLVYGVVLCRRGVLFLTNNNLKVLGGEVDTLIEQNTKIKVLQEALDSGTHNTPGGCRQEFHDNDIKPSQSSLRNNVSAQRNQGPTTSTNQNKTLSGRNVRPDSSVEPSVKDEELDEWDMEDLPMDEIMDELDDMTAPQTGNTNNNTNRSSSNPTIGSSSTGSTRPIQQCKDPTVQSYRGSGGGPRTEQTSGHLYNENLPLSSLISDCSGKSRPEVKPNVKRQRLDESSSSRVKQMGSTRLSSTNYDSAFNDDFEDEFDAFQEDVTASEIRNQQISTLDKHLESTKPMVVNARMKTEADSNRNSVAEDAGEKVKKLLSPLDSQHFPGVQGNKSKRTLFTGGSGDISVTNVPVKVEPASPSWPASPTMDHTVNSGQNTLDRFVRTSPGAPPSRQNGDSAKQKDGQTKLTDYTLLKTSNVGIDAEPFTYLSIVKKQLTSLDTATFKVKAYISTLIGRLDSSGGREWTLACKINDGSDSMDVDLSSGVLTSLIGFSAPDSMVMKRRAKHDPSIKDVLVEGIQQCQQKLIELLCIMEIRMTPTRPEVIALHQMTAQRISDLRNRVTQTLDNK